MAPGVSGSYRAFGNNGTHSCCNSSITSGTGASPDVLTALMRNSDHLPVVADYQLPAKMGVEVASFPKSVGLGESIAIDVIVSNIAPALFSNSADELDYTLSVTGDLLGGAAGMALPLTEGNIHQIALHTGTPGLKSGVLTVASDSQGAGGALFTLPIEFEVLAPSFEADFNGDSLVDAIDFDAWRANFGLEGAASRSHGDADSDGDVDGSDLLVWQRQFGSGVANVSTASAPEPGSIALGIAASLSLILRDRRNPSPSNGGARRGI